ncbi:MAG: long-chain fatty acid--CoA ligase [Bacteroidota bacterium]|nr:long-chain fatty acid--CoA ligase [Bacteroidota bacterium]MDP4233646.1 long-chain fatty acid--CoA ligase [Bacteroidota bacterium]MDP4243094.1 long-chain fatty acid--CoA ligase [Bacteroidota bacterium]
MNQNHPSPANLIEPFLAREKSALAGKVYLRYKRVHGEPFRDMTYAEFCRGTREIFAGLVSLGLTRGDRIALISESRPEWLMIEFASLALGTVLVPMFPTLTAQQVQFIVHNSGARVLFVSNDLQFGKALKIMGDCPALERVVILNDASNLAKSDARIMHLREVLSGAHLSQGSHPSQDFDSEAIAAKPEDVALMIYTSGTTGNPKGVMLTHRNIQANIDGALAALPELTDRDTALSFLPLSHAFEHLAMQFFFQIGFTIGLAESVDTVADNLLEIRPTIMTGVPRFYERVHTRIMRMRQQISPLRRHIFDWAVGIGGLCGMAIEGKQVPLHAKLLKRLAERLVLQKIRERTGGRVRFFVSGAAALPADVGRAFASFGLPIIEGYGMTECSPVISVSPYNHLKWGTVGKPIGNMQVKIAGDGEILARGPSVMKGYYKMPDETREIIDSDGWLHTGDVGEIDSDGYIRITDRKKHLFVSSGGKNIAPAPIESALLQSRYIEQIMLIGDKRLFCTALIVPDFAALREDGKASGDPVALVERNVVRGVIQEELERLQKEFANYERVRRFVLLPEPFTVENDMLTPTLKVKRKSVEQRYRELIESLYLLRPANERT